MDDCLIFPCLLAIPSGTIRSELCHFHPIRIRCWLRWRARMVCKVHISGCGCRCGRLHRWKQRPSKIGSSGCKILRSVFCVLSNGTSVGQLDFLVWYGTTFLYENCKTHFSPFLFQVLSYTTDSEETTSTMVNETLIMEQVRNMCGAKFCPAVTSTINPNLIPPEPSKIQMLNIIFVICIVVASMLVMFGVDSLQR